MGIGTYNKLMALQSRCDTAFADIDVHLKHRHNIIPDLVETVRGYAKHESEVLTAVTEARASAVRADSPEMKLEAKTQLGQQVNSVLQIAERYPELKASPHFRDLQQQLTDAENRATASRRFYNLATDEYNSAIKQFPGNRIAHYCRLCERRRFARGIERVLIDEPVAIRF